ncbi:MAG: hypothetical protein V3V67_16445 [Myxococcota bacterium]
MIRAEGAPVDQGRAQGHGVRREIESGLRQLRGHYGAAAWIAARRRARRHCGRALVRQLPWQGERLEGIAAGAGVSLAALTLCEALYRVQGAGFQRGTQLEASFEVPAELEPLLALRASRPDAGGFPSVELTCAPFTGCLGGVNSEGIGVICLADRAPGGVSLRFLAQEMLFRARDLEAGIEHLRRRAAYLGGTGQLLLADSAGAARCVGFDAGSVRQEPACTGDLAREPMLRIDTSLSTLVWGRRGADACAVRPPEPLAESVAKRR